MSIEELELWGHVYLLLGVLTPGAVWNTTNITDLLKHHGAYICMDSFNIQTGYIRLAFVYCHLRACHMPSRLERLIKIEDLIRKGCYPGVERLCELFEVQPRTVYEDIRELKDRMHLDIRFDRFRSGYYNADPKKKLPDFDLTEGEILAITLGKDMLSQYTGTTFEPTLRGALEKIAERLPERVKINIADLQSMVTFKSAAGAPISWKMFMDLNRACEQRQVVILTYYAASKDEITERQIDPYRLLENRCSWYLVAYCHSRRDFRLFALHRIKQYQMTNTKFEPKPGFNIDEWIQSSFQLEHGDPDQTVRVRFGPVAARYVRERNWHPNQKLTHHANGSCTLQFPTRNLDEAKRWILTYGADAEVLEPEALKELIMAELRKALNKYTS